MKKHGFILLFLFLAAQLWAQPCTNFDFETGTFSGWSGAKGQNTTSPYAPLNSIVPGIFSNGMDASIHDSLARHTIVTGASGNDSCGGFPCVYPGGTYSVRLGNTTALYQGQYLEQTFVASDSFIMAHYAVVMSFSGHSAGEEPYFKIEALDNSGNLIPGSQTYISEFDSSGLVQNCSPVVMYMPWQTDTIDLTAYLGSLVTLRFTTAGCIYSGHYTYAYIDAVCNNSMYSIAENSEAIPEMWPNPTSGNVTVKLPDKLKRQRLRLHVYDCIGREVFYDDISGAPPDGRLIVNTTPWADGIYTVVIRGEETTLRGKLVKQ